MIDGLKPYPEYKESGSLWLGQMPAVETLRRVWVQQFYVRDNYIHWRTDDNIPRPRC